MKRIITAVFAASLLFFTSCCSNTGKDTPAKYIFLFIGDGMGCSNVAVAESYNAYVQDNSNFGLQQLCFTQFPVFGTCTTNSASGRVTDSAAAGSAISTGVKTNNGWLGVDKDGNPVNSMAVDLQDMGYNVGIFTSVPVNHATPAAFYAHVQNRGEYWQIATQLPEAGYKFFGGIGFLKDSRHKDADEEGYVTEHGYTVVYGHDEFEAQKNSAERMVYLTTPRRDEVGNYVSYAEEKEPALLETVMEDAIEYLGDDKPFFIMCEGGEIDWEAHSNNTLPMVMAINKMDDAVRKAYEFYLKHPKETLILVTADHQTGGVSLGSTESGYDFYWNVIIEDWEQNGLNRSEAHNNEINSKSGFAWTSRHHTGDPVPVYAIGKGAEKFSGRMDNTEFYSKILCK